MPDGQKHDWQRIVRERVSRLAIGPGREEEIVAELAAQLEDAYREALTRGMSETAAYQHSLSQFPDWKRLRRDIRRAEHGEGLLNRRVRVFWFPVLATISVTLLGMYLIFLSAWWISGIRETMGSGTISHLLPLMPFYLPFSLAGALGAWLSWRAGGSTRERLLVGASPAILMLASMTCIVWLSRLSPWMSLWPAIPTGFLIPLMFLLIGTLPFAFRKNVTDVHPQLTKASS